MVTPPSVIALFRLSRALSALTSVTKDLNVTVIIILEPLVDRLRRVGESVEQVAVTVSISGAVIGVFVMIRLRTSLSIAVTSAGLLGIFIGAKLQQNKPEFVLDVIQECGIDIRPEEMKITWNDVSDTLLNLSNFVREKQPFLKNP